MKWPHLNSLPIKAKQRKDLDEREIKRIFFWKKYALIHIDWRSIQVKLLFSAIQLLISREFPMK